MITNISFLFIYLLDCKCPVNCTKPETTSSRKEAKTHTADAQGTIYGDDGGREDQERVGPSVTARLERRADRQPAGRRLVVKKSDRAEAWPRPRNPADGRPESGGGCQADGPTS